MKGISNNKFVEMSDISQRLSHVTLKDQFTKL